MNQLVTYLPVCSIKKKYEILTNSDGTSPSCLCYAISFTNAGLPFFSQLFDFKYMGENETMVWWAFHTKGSPASLPFVFYVKNTPPGTPTIPVGMDTMTVDPLLYLNTTFSSFQIGNIACSENESPF